jgi:hypothetical protein
VSAPLNRAALAGPAEIIAGLSRLGMTV